MNGAGWQVDVKSLIIGFLLAAVAGLLFSGSPSRASDKHGEIAADAEGVYIMVDGSVRYFYRQKCIQGGCQFNAP